MSEARVKRAGLLARAMGFALVVACAAGIGMLVVSISYGLARVARVADDTHIGTERLIDCTTPGGKCYDAAQAGTAGAIGSINKVTVAAIYCSGKLGPKATLVELNQCVVAMVK